jgi:hypothetical protein
MVSLRPDLQWQIGKTAATIAFVNAAQEALSKRTDLAEDEKSLLKATVQMMKDGTVSLDKPETVDEWMERTFVPARHGFGANPPPSLAWQIGKTAATIRFVLDAEDAMVRRPDLSNFEVYQLFRLTKRLKRGEESLTAFETVDEWLNRLRDHHP